MFDCSNVSGVMVNCTRKLEQLRWRLQVGVLVQYRDCWVEKRPTRCLNVGSNHLFPANPQPKQLERVVLVTSAAFPFHGGKLQLALAGLGG